MPNRVFYHTRSFPTYEQLHFSTYFESANGLDSVGQAGQQDRLFPLPLSIQPWRQMTQILLQMQS